MPSSARTEMPGNRFSERVKVKEEGRRNKEAKRRVLDLTASHELDKTPGCNVVLYIRSTRNVDRKKTKKNEETSSECAFADAVLASWCREVVDRFSYTVMRCVFCPLYFRYTRYTSIKIN